MSDTSLFFSNGYRSRTMQTLFLALVTIMMATIASAAPPIGQTIWIRSSGTTRFVSADQARGALYAVTGSPLALRVRQGYGGRATPQALRPSRPHGLAEHLAQVREPSAHGRVQDSRRLQHDLAAHAGAARAA